MKSLSDCFAGTVAPIGRGSIIVVFAFLAGLNLRAAVPPTALRIQNTGADLEQWQTFQLEWDALSNATYRVQSGNFGDTPGLNGGDMVWKTIDVVTPENNVGKVTVRITPSDASGAGAPGAAFYRLALPEPAIFAVEPAVLTPGTSVDLYVVGQCFGSNDVLRINGDPQTNVVFNSSTLLSLPAFTPTVAGTYVFELVVAGQVQSSFSVTCADAFANPELVLQGPPEWPPAGPENYSDHIGARPAPREALLRRMAGGGEDFQQTLLMPALMKAKEKANRSHVWDSRSQVWNSFRTMGGPVAPHSGEVSGQAVDLYVPGRGLDFVWARTYNSRIGRTGAATNGWTFSYDVNIQPLGGDILIHDGTGRADTFKPGTNGIYTCPEFFSEGSLSNNVFTLTFSDTGYWEFKPLTAAAEAGKLAKIVDRNGNTMLLHYNGAGLLTQVVDDLDRTNTVAYSPAGQIESVTDFSGRTVRYEYDGHGDLVACVSPPVTSTPNGNDFPGGKTNSYTYSSGYLDDRENHLLLTVKDANGQTKHDYVYQHNQSNLEFLRCTSVQNWTNPPTVFTYLPLTPAPANQFATVRCVVNDPVGNVTEYFTDARGRFVALEEFTGRATPGLPVTATGNRPAGKLRSTDPDSYVTRWTWNNDSLCTLEISPGGQQEECVYESDFAKSPPARKRADLRVVREVACCDQDDDGDGLTDTLVTRFEYDPRFGSDPGLRTGEQHGCLACPHPGLGPLGIRKGWDGTIKGRFAAGPRQSTSLVQDFEKNTENVSGGFGIIDPGDDGGGFVTSLTDPRGNVTAASYDAKGNRVKVRFPWLDRHEETFWARNSYGEVVGVTNAPDANGHRRYDEYVKASGFTVQRILDAGPGGLRLTNKFERDVRGNVTRYEDARGHDWLYTYNSLDQCIRAQTPTNLSARCATDYFYDENDNLVQCTTEVRDQTDTYLTSRTVVGGYDRLHLLTRGRYAVDSTHWQTNEYAYDGNGQLVLVRGGDAISGADPHHTISHQYDERGMLFREIAAPGSPDQTTTQCDYDSNGNTIRLSQGLEGTPSTTTMEYDGFAGFGSSRIKAGVAGVVAGFGEVEYGLMRPGSSSSQLDCKSKEVCGNGLQVARIGPRLILAVDSSGSMRVSKITDPMGNQTTFNYDACANLKVIRHFGQTNDVAGTNGNTRLAESRYDYDALNRPIRTRDLFFDVATQAPISDGERTTTFAYAPNGQCTSVTDDLGRATTFAYDTAGRATNITSPNQRTSFAILLDAGGRATNCVQMDRSDLPGPPQVFAWTNVFDSLGRCVSTTDNVGNNENWDFDSLSRVVAATDPRGNHSFYEYDLLGRQTLAIRDLDGDGVPELSADYSERATWSTSNGRLLATTDSHDNITSYAYDSLGRCTNITHADGTQRKLVWSPKSNLIQETDANGTVAFHTYDLNGRCISNYYAPGPIVATTTTFETFSYDGCSRLVSASNDGSDSVFAYDSLGRNTRDVSGGLGALTTFDSVGNRLALTYPGGRALTYAYDALNRCTNILESGASLASFEYDGPGRVARVSYGNGTRTRILYSGIAGAQTTPDDFGWGQINTVNHAMAGGSPRIASVNLKWDRTGNKISRTDTIFAPAIPRTNIMALTYDHANRLVDSLVTSDGALVAFATYGLDRMGNRTNVNRPFCAGDYFMDALAPGPLDFPMNQYTTTPCDARTYDDQGNLTVINAGPVSSVSYSYDCHDRLVAVNDSGVPVATYAYDALGRRVSKTVFDSGGLPPLTTEFIYDGASVIEERENGAVTATFLRLGAQNGGVERSGFGSMRRSGQDYYFHPDDQGNVLAVTTTGGAVAERYDYDDFGTVTFLTSDGAPTSVTSSIVGNPYCWNGLRFDGETGLANNDDGNYYEPKTGRFIDGRYLLRAGIPLRSSANNPWSGGGGGSPSAMKSGTVKFFNEAKGFGRMGLINPIAMDKGLRFAIEPRDLLETYFETGDIPTQDQRMVPRNVLKSFFQTGDKPTQSQFGNLIDSMVNFVDDRSFLGLGDYQLWTKIKKDLAIEMERRSGGF